jgi:hypothetical protein
MNHCNRTGRRRTACLITLTLLLLVACQRTPRPEFTYVPAENPEAGEVILFINDTRHADSYSWDFGDGEGSSLMEPEHVFKEAGIFNVTLTAYNEGAESSVSQMLTIREPTLLGLIVTDSTGLLLQVAEIWIYDDQPAWENLEEPLASAYTDQEGTAVFMNMEPVIYFVRVSKEVQGGKWYYRGYTTVLEVNQSNWFSVPCRWLPDEPHP